LIQIRAEGGFDSYGETDQATNNVRSIGYLFKIYILIKNKTEMLK